MKLSQELRQTQRLNPLQIQTIKLIEKPYQELVQTVRKELEENPVLEEAAVTASYRFCEDGAVGPMCTKLYRHLTGIQFGEVEDTHGWCHPVC